MIAMGLRPNKYVYNSLIQGCCTHGDLMKPKELVTEMTSKGLDPPNVVFFSSIMQNLCSGGRVMEAQDMFKCVT